MTVSIRLSDDIERRLADLAKKTGRTKTFYLKTLIENGLDSMEDYYLGMDVLERVNSHQEEVHSESAVRAVLGL